MYLKIEWQENGGGARVLNVSGSAAEVVLPGEVEEIPITEIGDYCFAGKRVESAGEVRETCVGEPQEVRRIAGEYLEKLSLPNSVERIGNCAFYNCRKLRELVFGPGLESIGSDAFMNCRTLRNLTVRESVQRRTGLRQMLAQLTSGMSVSFGEGDACDAVILYPEYTESYDEISPAHIFGRKIEGEGFRARQSFKDGIVDFSGYDSIFPKACVEESAAICMRIAANRLRYPASLREEKRRMYEEYLTANADKEAVCFLREREKELLFFLCEQKYLSAGGVASLIQKAAEADWAEGAASLMRWKAEFYQRDERERYSFDEF